MQETDAEYVLEKNVKKRTIKKLLKTNREKRVTTKVNIGKTQRKIKTAKTRAIGIKRRVQVYVSIWGHGEQMTIKPTIPHVSQYNPTAHTPKKDEKVNTKSDPNLGPLFVVKSGITTNILGFAPSGVCSLIHPISVKWTDEQLRENPEKFISEDSIEPLSVLYRYILSMGIENKETNQNIKVLVDTPNNYYSFITNYGKKGRANKRYNGPSSSQEMVSWLPEMKIGAPMLRIYKIKTSDHSSVPSEPIDIHLVNYITLNEIVDVIAENMEKYMYDELEIFLYDNSCNWTEGVEPNVAYTEKPRTKYYVKKYKEYLEQMNTNSA